MKRTLGAAIVLFLGVGRCLATSEPDPAGAWDRDDGLGGIRITACGPALGGKIVWLKEQGGPARLGQTVLYAMERSGFSTWSGSAVNPEDGRTYAGTLSIQGRHMVTRGCVLGGMFCRSVALTRKQ